MLLTTFLQRLHVAALLQGCRREIARGSRRSPLRQPAVPQIASLPILPLGKKSGSDHIALSVQKTPDGRPPPPAAPAPDALAGFLFRQPRVGKGLHKQAINQLLHSLAAARPQLWHIVQTSHSCRDDSRWARAAHARKRPSAPNAVSGLHVLPNSGQLMRLRICRSPAAGARSS